MTMKHSDFSKIVGAGILSLGLTILPLSIPTYAQTTSPEPNQTNVENKGRVLDTTPFQETKNDRNNWGWLGLIGLIGLLNLFRKGREPAGYHETDAGSGTDSRH